jgi:erythromycin esterase-like protein
VAETIPLDPRTLKPSDRDRARLEALVDRVAGGDVVYLGEANHFVHEKVEFRRWWLERLAARRPLLVGEELSWSDGRHVAAFLASGDAAHLGRAATFGDGRHLRPDRHDAPSGVLAASYAAYPTAPFKAEQARFYRALRTLSGFDGEDRFFGFDIDAVGAGYEDLVTAPGEQALPGEFWARLERVEGESMTEEADRLEEAARILPATAVAARSHLEAMIGTLRYAVIAMPAPDYEALRPAMAWREEIMKRHVERRLAQRRPGDLLVLMGHAFHLVKDDTAIGGAAGVGPGGGLVASLGHHLVASGLRVGAVWMLYGTGEDSQPFPDLPRQASYPSITLNARLARGGTPAVLPVGADGEVREVKIGHMYNAVASIDLPAAVDAVHFMPTVTPLRDDPDGAEI